MSRLNPLLFPSLRRHEWVTSKYSGRRFCAVCKVGEYYSARTGKDGGCSGPRGQA